MAQGTGARRASTRAHATLTTMQSNAIELPGLFVVVKPPSGPSVEAPLGIAPIVVGTGADCDLVVADPRVSRRHCMLTLTESGIVLADLHSKNGLYHGGLRLVEAVLTPGKRVHLGGSTLWVRQRGEPSVVALSASASFGQALGGAVAMRALFATMERVAATAETILLLGESGTGKELIARAIHDRSPRARGPFVVFDCGAVVPSLVEAELFGHARGAFTGADRARTGLFAEAQGGTLFIDELGELPIDVQPKLLRALESRSVRPVGATDLVRVDVRVVAATHRDLHARVASGAFREDLYYRLAVVEARIPPLRERKDDIPLIVERFLAEMTPARTLDDLPPNTLDLLQAHHWPGNVRELRNTVARLVLFPQLGAEAISGPPSQERPGAGPPSIAPPPADPITHLPLRQARELAVERFEREYLAAKLREHGGSVKRTAEAMGVTRQLVHRLMVRHGR
jgi:DNA-binding NtrC family response regulator